MVYVIAFLLQAQAQYYGNETACNMAVQEFKKKCGAFVGQYTPSYDEPEGGDPKRCEQIRKISFEAEQKFKQVCVANADAATRSCKASATGGITGDSGATTMAEDLADLNHTLETFRQMYMRNIRSSGCPTPPMS